jgi:Uma2 family endonuclease
MIAILERIYNADDMAIDFASDTRQLHRFSLDEYHQLIEAGAFDEDLRVELVEGVLLDMSPKTREHENAISWLTRWLIEATDAKGFEVRVCGPITTDSSEPEPDLTVIPRTAPRPYHPGTASLVIEVAVSSQRRDRRQKPILYARAGIPEYWVIDLDAGNVVVHRTPSASGDRYESILTVPGDGRVEAQTLELPELSVAELLAAARR